MVSSNAQRKALPVIDLTGLDTAAPEPCLGVAEAIRQACGEIGFFYIINHGVPVSLCDEILRQTKALFDLPIEQKNQLDIKKSRFMRGYFGHGQDRSDGIHDDIKEGFDLAADLPVTDPFVAAGLPFYGPNTWPDCLAGFRQTMTRYYDEMIQLGMRLLRVFGIALGVEETFFPERFQNPIAQMRLLRYPPANEGEMGAGEHTDFGWLTMILQDSTGGLEIKRSNGTWIPVPAVPGSFVVNIGDLMQRWTNDEFVATWHRVVNRSNRPRLSAAFFMDPDYHVKVACLPSCASDARPARYEPIIAGDYMKQRFNETTLFASN